MEWWSTFFSGLWLEVQRAYGAEKAEEEAAFAERTLRLPDGATVLDVPCGNGRLSVELAARGHRVTGVDLTKPLLAEARAVADERGLSVEWEHRDMRDLPWSERFDAALCFWGSFGYFDDEGNRAFLEALHRALRPGGRVLIDVPNVAEGILPKYEPRGWWRAGDVLVIEERTWDHERSRIDVEWTLVRDGEHERKTTSLRVYTYRELASLLRGIGFAEISGCSSLDGAPFELGGRLYLTAVRPA